MWALIWLITVQLSSYFFSNISAILPNAAGWPAFHYQQPQFYEIWINPDTFPKRNQFTDVMLTSGPEAKKLQLIQPFCKVIT
ncbi:MAG: hypothetical protein IPF72_13660 [Chitinophagaceae bacterium]|nr:hypothetical protein [Chitinophagaceae bacterium]